MKYGSVTTKLLKEFRSARKGLTLYAAFNRVSDIYENDARMLHVYICQMVKKGYLYRDGSQNCETCHHPCAVYRISEQGRIALARLET